MRAAAASPATGAEQVADAEQIAENIAQILEGESAFKRIGAHAHALMSEAVVTRSLVAIGQHAVSF